MSMLKRSKMSSFLEIPILGGTLPTSITIGDFFLKKVEKIVDNVSKTVWIMSQKRCLTHVLAL